MATFFRDVGSKELQVSEATAGKRIIYYEVGTAEAQTITVSKAGAGFGATAGSTGTAVTGTLYKLTIHADDIDTEGEVAFASTGATDTQYILGLRVVDHDPFDAIAEILDDTGTSGCLLTVTERNATADAILSRALSQVEGTAAAGTVAAALAMLGHRTAVAGGTLTVYKSNDTTPWYTAAVTEDATADPITGINP